MSADHASVFDLSWARCSMLTRAGPSLVPLRLAAVQRLPEQPARPATSRSR